MSAIKHSFHSDVAQGPDLTLWGPDAINADHVIEDGAITGAHIADDAAIAESKLSLNHPTHDNANDPSSGQKAGLAGTTGTPADSNRYVTDADPRNTNSRDPNPHTHPSQVAGDSKAIQFNDAGAFAGETQFEYEKTTHSVKLGDAVTLLPDNPLGIQRSVDSYLQTNMQNTSSGFSASADHVLTADTGDDEQGYGDFGICNSTYQHPSWPAMGPLDTYLYGNGGRLLLGTDVDSGDALVFTGGIDDDHHRATFGETGIDVPAGLGYSVDGDPLALSMLGDVSTISPDVGQLLRYNGTHWVNGEPNPVSAGAGVNLYPTQDPSDLYATTGYLYAEKAPTDTLYVEMPVVCNADKVELVGYVVDAGVNTTVLDAGVWTVYFWAYASRTGHSQIVIDYYKRTAGGAETLLFSMATIDLGESLQQYTMSSIQPQYNLDPTDRLVVKVSGQTSNTSDTTIYGCGGDAAHAVYINTPLVLFHNDLSGLQGGSSGEYYHLTSAEKSAVDGLGTAAAKNIPATGNASTSEVVYGTDTRLADARTPTAHSHAPSDITGTAVITSDARLSDARQLAAGADKTKLDGIQAGAEVNVNADWNAVSGESAILNKPTLPSGQVQTDWNATVGMGVLLNKPSLLGLGETSADAYRGDRGKTAYDHSQSPHAPSNAEANVNADWSAVSGETQIMNKPTLGGAAALNVGTTAGTVAAGDDSRFAGGVTTELAMAYAIAL